MAPSPGNTPLVIGMAERAQRELIVGHAYVTFIQDQRYIGVYQGMFDHERVILQVIQHTCFGDMITNLIPKKIWVYELNESTIVQN